MITIRIAAPADAHVLWDAERRTALTPGRLVARPGEVPVDAFKAKIEALVDRGRYIVAEEGDVPVGHAISLYRNFGFVEEGRFKKRIALPDGTFVDDVAMAWFPS